MPSVTTLEEESDFIELLDDLLPLRFWPVAIRKLLSSPTINNNQRFSLFCFLVGNGINPQVVKDRILLPRCRDNDAVRHVNWLVTNAHKYVHKWTYWDVPDSESKYMDGKEVYKKL